MFVCVSDRVYYRYSAFITKKTRNVKSDLNTAEEVPTPLRP